MVERMGLLDELRALRTRMRGMSVVDADGTELMRDTARAMSSVSPTRRRPHSASSDDHSESRAIAAVRMSTMAWRSSSARRMRATRRPVSP